MIMMMSGGGLQTRHPRPGQEEGVQTSEGAQCGECDDVCEANFLMNTCQTFLLERLELLDNLGYHSLCTCDHYRQQQPASC